MSLLDINHGQINQINHCLITIQPQSQQQILLRNDTQTQQTSNDV